MTLIKWTPKKDMLNFFDDVERMISQSFSHPLEIEHESDFFIPCMNVNETDLDYIVSIDLPGVDKRDVDVNMSEDMVTIIGKRGNSQEGKDNSCIWKETPHGTFRRSFELSKTVQGDKIKARFKNGVLNLTVPKAEEVKSEVKKITVS